MPALVASAANRLMVRQGDWKYVYHAVIAAQHQLYNLVEDPKELHNLAAKSKARIATYFINSRNGSRKAKPHPGASFA